MRFFTFVPPPVELPRSSLACEPHLLMELGWEIKRSSPHGSMYGDGSSDYHLNHLINGLQNFTI